MRAAPNHFPRRKSSAPMFYKSIGLQGQRAPFYASAIGFLTICSCSPTLILVNQLQEKRQKIHCGKGGRLWKQKNKSRKGGGIFNYHGYREYLWSSAGYRLYPVFCALPHQTLGISLWKGEVSSFKNQFLQPISLFWRNQEEIWRGYLDTIFYTHLFQTLVVPITLMAAFAWKDFFGRNRI